jgi:hypothetical protein
MPDALINLSSGTQEAQLVAAPTSPSFIRIMEYHVSASAATNFQLYSGPNLIDAVIFNGTTPVPFAADGTEVAGVVDCGIGQPLLVSSTVGVQVQGTLKYAIKP